MIGPGAMNVFCAACDTRLRTRYDTNGMGGTVELVQPCPKCIRSRSSVVITRGPEYVVRHGECGRCGEAFEWAKPGVLPAECATCQALPKVRTGTCRKCERAFEWTKQGPLPHRCPDCASKRETGTRSRPCRQCGKIIVKTGKGIVPKDCKRCKRLKRLECEDCGDVRYVERSRGPYPKTCENCEGRTA